MKSCKSLLYFGGAMLLGGRVMSAEALYPKTDVGTVEVKTLPAAVVMATHTKKTYFDADNGMFMTLFRFIRENKVSMTVPVEAEIDPGVMRFYLGPKQGRKKLQDTTAVTVRPVEARRVVAVGLRGGYSGKTFRRGLRQLEAWLKKNPDHKPAGSAYAVYWNSPFVPGFLKRSEVHIPLARQETANAQDQPETNRKETAMIYNELSPEEERIIVHKGTEKPFSGAFFNHFEPGVYTCRRCDAPLYRADDKFKSGCGWPSFDDELPGAVTRKTDRDGRRTEILCAGCDAHLGHVFEGERMTEKNTRHCVNSVSLSFSSDADGPIRRAIFASGCFWGTEAMFSDQPGVRATTVGYTGGHTEFPTYRDVCSGRTGHAEAVEVVFDTRKTNYETLAKRFFETHDPTQHNRQGPDVGTQYRSAIFYLNDAQKEIAHSLKKQLESRGLRVTTEITQAGRFWTAEDYHQDYYSRKGTSPYCHSYTERF